MFSVWSKALRFLEFPSFSRFSIVTTEQLHWLPLSARSQFKILFLIHKISVGLAPRYLCKLIMYSLPAIYDRPIRSLDRNDVHSSIPFISIAPLQVYYYTEALPTKALILCRS